RNCSAPVSFSLGSLVSFTNAKLTLLKFGPYRKLRPALPLKPKFGRENAHGSKNNRGVPSAVPGAITRAVCPVPSVQPKDPPRVIVSACTPGTKSARFWPPFGPPTRERD